MSPSPLLRSSAQPKTLTVLGSTGSIGCNTLKLAAEHRAQFRIVTLTAQENVELLIAQALEHRPQRAVIGNPAHYEQLKSALAGSGIEAAAGDVAILEAAQLPSDIVMSSIVGTAGLAPTLAAIRRGATIAMANKECLVSAGPLFTEEVKRHGATLIPVDSEHNAIFQIFAFDAPQTVEKIIITASGGPLRTMSLQEMAKVTPAQAVKHPNWSMGAKISVDSATLMNKGLELIEAYHLFPVSQEQLGVLIHPESVIHSLVYYTDGSVLAQMSLPDMCTPIAYALAWPERLTTQSKRLDLAAMGALHFETPDTARFPALALAQQALSTGGTAPAILNAANEIAVHAFLAERIGFLDIVKIVEKTLEIVPNAQAASLEAVLAADGAARRAATELIGTIS